jgi:predicted nuclease of restriction endonuclease-like (RecB) superfamily
MVKDKNHLNNNAYLILLREIKDKIISARIKALRGINKELIELYWVIGRTIVKRQQEYGWGTSIVEKLSKDLQKCFNLSSGYSSQNLWYMRQFYIQYRADAKLQQLVGEIPWGHNILIFSKIKDKREREYYLRASAELGWSRNVLHNQIRFGACQKQKIVPKQHNFPAVLPALPAEQADEPLKSVYNLDFLGITRQVIVDGGNILNQDIMNEEGIRYQGIGKS